MPLVVTRRVNELVNKSNIVILEILLEQQCVKLRQLELRETYGVNEDWHEHCKISNPIQQGCGCEYCKALSHYIQVKFMAHRLKKRLDNWDYVYDSVRDARATENLFALETEWPRLRAIKNQIKIELGL